MGPALPNETITWPVRLEVEVSLCKQWYLAVEYACNFKKVGDMPLRRGAQKKRFYLAKLWRKEKMCLGKTILSAKTEADETTASLVENSE